MDWDLFRFFNAVAEAGDYSGAARRLRSSHPTVGRKIAQLEKELGVRLFVRGRNGLALSESGTRLAELTGTMAGMALQAETNTGARGSNVTGIVRFSIGPTLATHWLMPHLRGFLRAHPGIELELVTHPFPVSVMKREADIVLRVYENGDENLVGRKIARLAMGFYASADYATRHSLPQRKEDWEKHTIINFADKDSNRQLGRWTNEVSFRAKASLRCSSQSDMLAAVRAGLGICALSRFVGDSYPDLVRVAPTKLGATSDVWLLAHPDLIGLPAVRTVIDFVAACAKRDRDLLRMGQTAPSPPVRGV